MHCICVSSALSGSVHRSTKATSTHGVLNLLLAPFTVARRRIDHKGFASFHRDRPPILIVSGKLGSTTLFGHTRVQKPNMSVGCAVCVLQPLTAEHGPAPVTALLHARMFTVYCAGGWCRAGTTRGVYNYRSQQNAPTHRHCRGTVPQTPHTVTHHIRGRVQQRGGKRK